MNKKPEIEFYYSLSRMLGTHFLSLNEDKFEKLIRCDKRIIDHLFKIHSIIMKSILRN